LKITDMWMSAIKTMFLLLGLVTVVVGVGNVLLTDDISIALCFVFTVESNVVQY